MTWEFLVCTEYRSAFMWHTSYESMLTLSTRLSPESRLVDLTKSLGFFYSYLPLHRVWPRKHWNLLFHFSLTKWGLQTIHNSFWVHLMSFHFDLSHLQSSYSRKTPGLTSITVLLVCWTRWLDWVVLRMKPESPRPRATTDALR